MLQGIEDFKKITRYDIEKFFNDYVDFVSQYYQFIVDYYNGGKLNGTAFKKVDDLLTECDTIEAIFELNQYQFNTVDFWTIQDTFSEVHTNLLTCKKMSKWARSSRLNQFDSSLKVERGLRQFETFERVSSSLGSNNGENDWASIAVDNLITEEDYTTDGGAIFSVKADNGANSTIANIVDSLTGENVYGKDIKKKFTFVDNDIETVAGSDCLSQSLETKLSTTKGDIPEFPDMGLSPQSTSSNVNSIQYPSIFRNLLTMFQGDGRWSEINLLDIGREEDAVFIKIEAKTILGDSFKTNLKI